MTGIDNARQAGEMVLSPSMLAGEFVAGVGDRRPPTPIESAAETLFLENAEQVVEHQDEGRLTDTLYLQNPRAFGGAVLMTRFRNQYGENEGFHLYGPHFLRGANRDANHVAISRDGDLSAVSSPTYAEGVSSASRLTPMQQVMLWVRLTRLQ